MIDSAPDLTTESRTATFAFSAMKPGDYRFECALDSGTFSPCNSPKTYTGMPAGPHTFQVRVLSPDAVIDPPVTSHDWTVLEATPPDTTIVDGPALVTGSDPSGNAPPIAFLFTSNDSLATFECAIDGQAFTECESPVHYDNLTVGEHFFRVRAIDPALNPDPTPASYLFRVAAMPETFIDSGPEGELGNSTATFMFSSNLTGSTFECSLNLGPWEACPTPYELRRLADGEYSLEVRAVSPLGIADATPEEWSWDVAGSAPDTTVVSGPAASTTSQIAAFTFSSTE